MDEMKTELIPLDWKQAHAGRYLETIARKCGVTASRRKNGSVFCSQWGTAPIPSRIRFAGPAPCSRFSGSYPLFRRFSGRGMVCNQGLA